jgi:hypothetical protein
MHLSSPSREAPVHVHVFHRLHVPRLIQVSSSLAARTGARIGTKLHRRRAVSIPRLYLPAGPHPVSLMSSMHAGHPLDGLSANEIREAAAACKAYAAVNAVEPIRFNVIALKEPSKAEIIAYDRLVDHGTLSPPAPLRAAFCILQTPKLAGVIEVVVALKGLAPEDAGASQVSPGVASATHYDAFIILLHSRLSLLLTNPHGYRSSRGRR